MKKTLALILAAVMLAAALAGCAAAPSASLPANIRVTSSDAADKAAWLNARLGDKLTDRIVIGTNADGYGVDVSALEDDGYFIRSLGDEVALFARTADGLDRAARKYAKMAETGDVTDVTYHEGARIKRIEIAGRDISEYTVYAADDARVTAAAEKFASFIERACGVKLPVVTGEAAAPYISLGYVHDETLGNVGYTWAISEDGLTLGFSDKYAPTSPEIGVTRYIEKALDWFGLSYGYEDLPEAELISLEVGESGSDACAFDYINLYGDYCSAPDTMREFPVFPYYTNIPGACHGILPLRLAGDLSKTPEDPWRYDEPCWLDEEFYEYSLQDLTDYIEAQIAAGYVPGETLRFIDVAQSDNAGWCKCKKCSDLYKAEGLTHAAEVLTWANRVSDELNEKYPGIYYGVFAYWDTKKLPTTIRPNEHLFITFCSDGNCAIHALDGSKCTTGEPINNWKINKAHDNATVAAYLEQWLGATPNVYLWYYSMGNGMLTGEYTHTVRDNVRYFADIGLKGISWQAEDEGYSTNKAGRILTYALAWDPYMSDEEYDALYDRVLRVLYGEGAGYVREYIDLEAYIYESSACATCWGWGNTHWSINPTLWARYYDDLFIMTESALSLADCEKQEYRLKKVSCECIFKCSLSSYFPAYGAHDDERIAELSRRYALIDERLTSIGIDMETINPFNYMDPMYKSDLAAQAWEMPGWKQHAADMGLSVPEREAPEIGG